MIATVTYPYRDRETLEIHRAGEEVELSAERFTELSAAGYVDAREEPKAENTSDSPICLAKSSGLTKNTASTSPKP